MIINQMPPHRAYIEPFLGSGAVMRRKRPAAVNFGCDLDADVIATACRLAKSGEWISPADNVAPGGEVPLFAFERGDGIEWMRRTCLQADDLVYCDPPYLNETRRQQRRLYRYELSRARHVELAEACRRLPGHVMVSGYRSELYDQAFADWRLVTYTAQTHGGPATECLWMNYPEPRALHDYRYLGRDYRERERIRRRQARWYRRLLAMPDLERRAMVEVLQRAGAALPVLRLAARDPADDYVVDELEHGPQPGDVDEDVAPRAPAEEREPEA